MTVVKYLQIAGTCHPSVHNLLSLLAWSANNFLLRQACTPMIDFPSGFYIFSYRPPSKCSLPLGVTNTSGKGETSLIEGVVDQDILGGSELDSFSLYSVYWEFSYYEKMHDQGHPITFFLVCQNFFDCLSIWFNNTSH